MSHAQTNGFKCQTDPKQCFCTDNGASSITVDLGSSLLVTKVVVRGSFDYDNVYVKDSILTVSCSRTIFLKDN